MVMVRELSREFKNVRFDLFLDRAKVQRAIDRKSQRALSRTGGFIKTRVERSMRKRPQKRTKTGKRSKPFQKFLSETNKPPRWVTRGLKDNIFFFYDPNKRSVVIGPRPFPSTSTGKPTRRRSGASLLEFGGAAIVKVTNRKGQPWVRATFRRKPFMAPQMDIAQSKLRENLQRFGDQIVVATARHSHFLDI